MKSLYKETGFIENGAVKHDSLLLYQFGLIIADMQAKLMKYKLNNPNEDIQERTKTIDDLLNIHNAYSRFYFDSDYYRARCTDLELKLQNLSEECLKKENEIEKLNKIIHAETESNRVA